MVAYHTYLIIRNVNTRVTRFILESLFFTLI